MSTGTERPVRQEPILSVCEKARTELGDGAECVETELPDLTSPAGKVTRVTIKGDETRQWIYVVTRPDGSMIVGGGTKRAGLVDALLRAVDARTIEPVVLAKLNATLDTEVAIVRCVPGTNDVIPAKSGVSIECTPPTLSQFGDKLVLSYLVEEFAHPHVRNHHRVSLETFEVREHKLSPMSSGKNSLVAELPVDSPLPASLPALPGMTSPWEWGAKPVAAAADVSEALCAAARRRYSPMTGRTCKAFAYPSLDTSIGSLFYLANDAGVHMVGLKKPDGTIVADRGWLSVPEFGAALETIVKTYDPKLIPADKLASLYLFLQSDAVRVLCLAGTSDGIAQRECRPPTAEKMGDAVVLTFFGEELPVLTNVRVHKRAVRSFRIELTPSAASPSTGLRGVRWSERRDLP